MPFLKLHNFSIFRILAEAVEVAFLISNRTVHCSALPWNNGTILDTNRTSVALDVS